MPSGSFGPSAIAPSEPSSFSFTESVVLLIAGYFLAVCVCGYLPRSGGQPDGPRDITIFVRSNGVHTDIVVPVQVAGIDWRSELPPRFFKRSDPGNDHVAFGWGDKGFYLDVPTWGDLTASAALNAITEAFAFEYGPKVRVNTISPGRFLTDVSKAWSEEHKLNSTAALKRSGRPEEIVTAALYLASSKSSFTTGSLVRVDGGIA